MTRFFKPNQKKKNKLLNIMISLGRVDGGDDGLLGMAVALNHSAARHKISIRPKRNHAPARPRQLPQVK